MPVPWMCESKSKPLEAMVPTKRDNPRPSCPDRPENLWPRPEVKLLDCKITVGMPTVPFPTTLDNKGLQN